MADAEVDKLAHRVMGLVERDTVDGVSSLRPGQRLELDEGHVEQLTPLAHNLDIPARLAPSMYRFAKERDPRWLDRRADARSGLVTLVARCADALEPDSALPPPADPTARDRLATAVTRAYAFNATPRLVADLAPNGRPDDLGLFAPPQLEGDVAAARAMAVAIGARTATGEDEVLRRLVADGHGGAAYAAAELLLKDRADYRRMPETERPAIRDRLARSIEAGFAKRDVREARQRELTEELENRRTDVTGGAGTIDEASAMATDELGKLAAQLRGDDLWQRSAGPSLDELRALVAQQLVTRVEHHAQIQTELTDEQAQSPGAATVAAADTMVLASAIPQRSRPAAARATATMLTEGFDELPARVSEWRAAGQELTREATRYGANLGDRTAAAVRTFEAHPPEPLPDTSISRFAADSALPRPQAVPAPAPASPVGPRVAQPDPKQVRDR